MKAFRAYSKHGGVTAGTPRAAAQQFFIAFPTARKCSVVEGTVGGDLFTVTFGRSSTGEWPQSWRDVTRKTLTDLPE